MDKDDLIDYWGGKTDEEDLEEELEDKKEDIEY